MREILFRGKRIDNGEWVEGFLLKECNYVTCSWNIAIEYKTDRFGKFAYDVAEVKPETVGQYTGLTDKNGKKIFEGDIVKYGDTIHKVVFEQRYGTAYFGLVYSEIETLPFGHYQDLKQIEVIGSIHDDRLEDFYGD